MAARHMTGGQFMAELGFGQTTTTPESFPEYPPFNTKLQELDKRLPPDSSALHAARDLLLLARQLRGQGNHAEESKVLMQVDQMLDYLMSSTSAGTTTKVLAAIMVLLVMGGLVYAFWPQIQASTKPRENPKRRRHGTTRRQGKGKSKRGMPPWLKAKLAAKRKARANAEDDPDDDDAEDDDGDGGEDGRDA